MIDSNEEIIIINALISNGNKLWDSYKVLATLENKNLKNNFEYISNVNKVIKLINEERTLYSLLNVTKENEEKYLKYITSKYYVKGISKIIDAFSDSYEGISVKRMINKIIEYADDSNCYTFDKTSFSERIAQAYERDLFHLTLLYFKECCDNTKNKELIEKYCFDKYEIAMINSSFEYEIINNRFEMNSEFILCSPLVANSLMMPTKIYMNTMSHISYNYLVEQINDIKNSRYVKNRDIIKGIKSQCLARAYFSFLNPKDILAVNIRVNEMLAQENLIEERRINAALIKEIISKSIEDSKKIKYLTIERKK